MERTVPPLAVGQHTITLIPASRTVSVTALTDATRANPHKVPVAMIGNTKFDIAAGSQIRVYHSNGGVYEGVVVAVDPIHQDSHGKVIKLINAYKVDGDGQHLVSPVNGILEFLSGELEGVYVLKWARPSVMQKPLREIVMGTFVVSTVEQFMRLVPNTLRINAMQKKWLRMLFLRRIVRARETNKQRSHWVHPLNQNRNVDGEHVKLDSMFTSYPERFAGYTRMCHTTFSKLLALVGSSLVKKDTNYRTAVPVRVRLYIILRYLATGDNIRTIATNFSVGHTTVWKILHEGIPAIWDCLKKEYVRCPSKQHWKSIVEDFYKRWNFPNCLGAIDGKHVVMECPPKSGSLYFNYKGSYSIVLLATCDSEYNFTTIDVGGYGKQSDGGIFSGSTLGKKLESDTFNTCGPRMLPGTGKRLPCVFVGDEAFPLSTFMMRPYPGKSLNESRRIYNYRLSRARRCIENAFGIMAARFRIFRRPISAFPKQVENIVLCCVALHNFLKAEEKNFVPNERAYCPPGFGDDSIDVNDGAWRQEPASSALLDFSRLSIPAREKMAKQMREDLVSFVVNEGRVGWQLGKIGININNK